MGRIVPDINCSHPRDQWATRGPRYKNNGTGIYVTFLPICIFQAFICPNVSLQYFCAHISHSRFAMNCCLRVFTPSSSSGKHRRAGLAHLRYTLFVGRFWRLLR